MYPRHRPLWLVVLGVVGLLGGCGSTFRSVRETAVLGERMGMLAPVLAHAPRHCDLQAAGSTMRAVAAGAQPADLCADLRVAENAAIMLRGSALIAAYAGAMNDLAQGRDVNLATLADFLGNAAATAAGSPGTMSVASAGNKLSAVMGLLTTAWRRRELRRYIVDAEPPLRIMVERLRDHVRLLRVVLRGLKGTAPGTASPERGLIGGLRVQLVGTAAKLSCAERDDTCQALRQFAQVWSMSLSQAQAWVEDEDEALVRYDRALADFWAAFTVLHRRAAAADDSFAEDGAMYLEIKDALHRASRARRGN